MSLALVVGKDLTEGDLRQQQGVAAAVAAQKGGGRGGSRSGVRGV